MRFRILITGQQKNWTLGWGRPLFARHCSHCHLGLGHFHSPGQRRWCWYSTHFICTRDWNPNPLQIQRGVSLLRPHNFPDFSTFLSFLLLITEPSLGQCCYSASDWNLESCAVQGIFAVKMRLRDFLEILEIPTLVISNIYKMALASNIGCRVLDLLHWN